jgi:hypothetical protein
MSSDLAKMIVVGVDGSEDALKALDSHFAPDPHH